MHVHLPEPRLISIIHRIDLDDGIEGTLSHLLREFLYLIEIIEVSIVFVASEEVESGIYVEGIEGWWRLNMLS
jgi:hypothetical protein